jgi:outer membrane protein OmpA-like peptidoglycan-associated protein
VSEVQSKKVFEVYRSFQKYFRVQPRPIQLGYYQKRITLSDIQGFLENSVRPPSNQGNRGRTQIPRETVEKFDRYASVVEEDNRHLIEVKGAITFLHGSAELRSEGVPSLLRTAAWLNKSKDANFKIVGHTSSRPLPEGADADNYMDLGYLRAMAVARFLTGTGMEESLSELASRMKGSERHLSGKIKNLWWDRLMIATYGNHSPNPSGGALWENADADDRVEIMFLPRNETEDR